MLVVNYEQDLWANVDTLRKTFKPVETEIVIKFTRAGYEPRYIPDHSLWLLGRSKPDDHLCVIGSGSTIETPRHYVDSLPIIGGLQWLRSGYNRMRQYVVKRDHLWLVENISWRNHSARYGTVGPFKNRRDHYESGIPDWIYSVPLLEQ